MADEELKPANGGDDSETPAGLADGGPVSLSFANSGGEEHAAALQQEIEALKRDRSDLQRRLDGLLADMERSEVEKKALAAHASYLEGALSATHHDLATAESAAADSDADAQALKNSLDALKAGKTKLEARIPDLEANIAALEKREADLGAQKEEALAALAASEKEILALARELDALKLAEAEAKKATEAEAKRSTAREGELEKALKETEVKMAATAENHFKVERDFLLINDKDAEADTIGGNVSWAAAAGLAASSATVAAMATVLYFHYARQR